VKNKTTSSAPEILVTTGYFVPFTRLFQAMDHYAGVTGKQVLVQGNRGDYSFRHAEHVTALTNLHELMKQAEVVITHGAMTLVEILELGVPLVAVPRRLVYKEHIDDHQVCFAKWLAEKYNFPVVMEIDDLFPSIEKAEKTVPPKYESEAKVLNDFLAATLEAWALE